MNCFRSLIITALACAPALMAQGNPFSNDAKLGYLGIKNVIIRAAEKMPAENYSFRTTPQVRTYGEIIAHIADLQLMLCASVKGEQKTGDAASRTSKADLVAALKGSFNYCDPVYDSMTDAAGVQMMKMFGRDWTRLGVLQLNIAHDNEMYGQMVAYLRIKNLVPPSSEPRP